MEPAQPLQGREHTSGLQAGAASSKLSGYGCGKDASAGHSANSELGKAACQCQVEGGLRSIHAKPAAATRQGSCIVKIGDGGLQGWGSCA